MNTINPIVDRSFDDQKVIKFPVTIRAIAWILSIIFHPLFVPVLATWYLTYLQPGFFMGTSDSEKKLVLLRVAYNTIFFPAIAVLLLKAVGFIKSIFLKTQRDRIVPYITTNIFYFWMYLVFKNTEGLPIVLTSFIFGIFLACSFALLSNIYFKISMHALGMGALLGLLLVIILSGFPYLVFLPTMVLLLIAGLVCTSRLIISDHTTFEIYTGLLFGILTQLVAFIFIRS